MSFAHLHNHSHYSLLDGAQHIKTMIKKTKELGMSSIALTDHGNMFGAMEFYMEANKEGVKPILGMEAYIIGKGSRHSRSKANHETREDKTYHIVLLCENNIGYKNLIKLSSLSYIEGYYYKPRIDKELLKKYSEGIIGLTACLGGEITNLHLKGRFEEAKQVLEEYLDIFGKENFFLEIQRHGVPEDIAYERNVQLGKEYGVGYVATNDVHYTEKEQSSSHNVLICMQGGKKLSEVEKPRYEPKEFYLRAPKEMREIFKDIPEACDKTLEIAERCHVTLDINKYKMPIFPVPKEEGKISMDEYLERKAERGLKERYNEITEELKKRIRYELDVIQKMGFSSYFLLVADFVEKAKEKGIPVGLGRGSVAGSLVAYVLGITAIDPIQYGLIFERFLNPDRVSMPDADIDFCMRRREEVINYVREKYGENNVCQIITYGKLATKNVLKDVSRVLGISFEEANKITKLVPVKARDGNPISVSRAFSEVPELKKIKEKGSIYQDLVKYAENLEGVTKSIGTHAAGVIIAPDEVSNIVPVAKNNQGVVLTQYDMKYSELNGLLKVDFLGLRTLTVIDDTVKMVQKKLPRKYENFDINGIPLDDKKTFELYEKGNTVGVFQFESQGMKDYLYQLKPTRIEDLIAMNALYRPGPMKFIGDFIDRKHGKKQIQYLHPLLEPILEETYGVIVYQEQVMRIVSELGCFSLSEADIVRRAMGKKQEEVMNKYREKFVKQASEQKNVKISTARAIYDMIVSFAEYGFNKSHSAAYAILSYQTAYLKTYFPAEFMATLLQSEIGSPKRITILIAECKRIGLRILPPDVNTSYPNFSAPDKKTISFGMCAIKNVGLKTLEAIVTYREETKMKYTSIFNLAEYLDRHSINRKALEGLIKSGALDGLKGSRAQKFHAVNDTLAFASNLNRNMDKSQCNLFGEQEKKIAPMTYPTLYHVKEWTELEILNKEREALGFYISGHPLEEYRDFLNGINDIWAEKKTIGKKMGYLGGIIANKKEILTKKDGKKMCFLTVESFDMEFEVIVFPYVYEKYPSLLGIGRRVLFRGGIEGDGENLKILMENVFSLEEAKKAPVESVIIKLRLSQLTNHIVEKLSEILGKKEGGIPISFYISEEGLEEGESRLFRFLSDDYGVTVTSSIIQKVKELLGNDSFVCQYNLNALTQVSKV